MWLDEALGGKEKHMNLKRSATVIAIAILFTGVLPAISGCAGMTFELTNQPQRMPTPDQLPQIYRNY